MDQFVRQSWPGSPHVSSFPSLPSHTIRFLPLLSSLPFPFSCPPSLPCLPPFPSRRKLKRPSRILLVDWGSAVSYPSAGSGGTRPRQQKTFLVYFEPGKRVLSNQNVHLILNQKYQQNSVLLDTLFNLWHPRIFCHP